MFKNDLIAERVMDKKNTWELHEDLIWEDEKIKVVVRKGFIFDFASVPRIFWNIFSPNGGRYDRASCLHDWLYEKKCVRVKHMIKNKLKYVPTFIERKEADEIFYKAMLADGTPKWKAKIFYWAVRIGGGSRWGK